MIEIRIGKNVVSTSKNLRGILDYSRKHAVTELTLMASSTNLTGVLQVKWDNGAWTHAGFASYNVMRQWVLNRRMFHGVAMTLFAPNAEYWQRQEAVLGTDKARRDLTRNNPLYQ